MNIKNAAVVLEKNRKQKNKLRLLRFLVVVVYSATVLWFVMLPLRSEFVMPLGTHLDVLAIFGVGFVYGGLVTSLTVYAVNRLSKAIDNFLTLEP